MTRVDVKEDKVKMEETDFGYQENKTSSEEDVHENEIQEKNIKEDSSFENFEYSLAKDLEHCTSWSFGLLIFWPFMKFRQFYASNPHLPVIFQILLALGIFIFAIFAMVRNFTSHGVVFLSIGVLVALFKGWDFIDEKYNFQGPKIKELHKKRVNWIIGAIFLCFAVAYALWTAFGKSGMNAQNLIGISGLISYILLSIILSVAPHRIKWRPVIWGIGTQYVAAVIVLHTKWGYAAFEWLGEIISKFVSYAAFGIEFLFGADFPVGNFAFAVLPIIVFFSMVTSMLYYVGFLQYIIKKLAWLFSYFFGTTGPESMTTVGNMFLSMTESPLLIKPHINNLTNAEIFAVMTAGFASIAGSVLGGYIALGISAAHLLTATVMSAPAALAIAKIIHPEVQVSRYAGGKIAETSSEKLEAGNIIEAASKGISEAINIVLNVAANLLGFVAIQNLLDDVLAWLGNSVDQPGWSFSGLLGYIFYPFVIVMGIEPQDAIASARLVGTKTFFNEFIAFLDLSEMIKKRESGKV